MMRLSEQWDSFYNDPKDSRARDLEAVYFQKAADPSLTTTGSADWKEWGFTGAQTPDKHRSELRNAN